MALSTRDELLDMLLGRLGEYISGEAISEKVNLTRAAIWKQVHALQQEGFVIESLHGKGYRLLSIPDVPRTPVLHLRLRQYGLSWRAEYHDEITSTNQRAKELAAEGAEHGILVVAERQNQGRGRKGRVWHSPAGAGLWMTAILHPKVPMDAVQKITLLAAVAVADAMAAYCPPSRIAIKWPNDIWLDGRKVCGILTEMAADMEGVRWVVVGIGINVHFGQEDFPSELWHTATSLAMAGFHAERAELAARVCAAMQGMLEGWERTGDFSPIAARYRAGMALVGEWVRIADVAAEVEGCVQGVDDSGALVLRQKDGSTRRILTGEVTVRRI